MRMASPVVYSEDFARLVFRTVEQQGADGWMRYRDALDVTMDAHPDHPYVAYVKEKPGRRLGLATVAERIREAEFGHIHRQRAPGKKNAPVYYRVGRPGAAMDLDLPFVAPANHPLRLKRRWFEGEAGAPSGRYAALTRPEPTSPWRRRLRAGWRRSGRPWPGSDRLAEAAWAGISGVIKRLFGHVKAVLSRP
jgi:hypothetical protein